MEATRIALAFQGLYGDAHYLAIFHLALYARRGVKNGQRALDVRDGASAPTDMRSSNFADSDVVTMAMRAARDRRQQPQSPRHPLFRRRSLGV